jgi:hypothetical protein
MPVKMTYVFQIGGSFHPGIYKQPQFEKYAVLFALLQVSRARSRRLNLQGPVVQRVDNTIHRINRYPMDKCWQTKLRYPLDRDLSGG